MLLIYLITMAHLSYREQILAFIEQKVDNLEWHLDHLLDCEGDNKYPPKITVKEKK